MVLGLQRWSDAGPIKAGVMLGLQRLEICWVHRGWRDAGSTKVGEMLGPQRLE